MTKKLSVIIPCYNQGHFIVDAIESVVNADKNGICEIIVINDGSTDPKTIEIFNGLSYPNLKIHNQENQGLAKARNKGVELSTTAYLLMLDSDNKITDKFIAKFEDLLNRKEDFDAIHGNSLFFGEKYDNETFIYKSEPLNLFKISKANYIDACSIVKKETLVELGMYDHKMPYMGLEDWDLWIRMALKGKKVIYFDEIFFHYRYSEGSMIRTIGDVDSEIRDYLVRKYDNVMFKKDFLLNNLPYPNFDEMNYSLVIKELTKRIFKKIKRKFNG
jgi:glycosyltransferase involved in cell wall biosynthesis